MKYYLVILLLISHNFIFSQKLSAKIVYEVNIENDDVSKIKAKPEEVKKDIFKLYKNSKPVNAVLLVNKNKSKYFVEEELENEGSKKINFIALFAGSNSIQFTDNSRKFNITQHDITGELLRISSPQKEWILTKESKKINNYLCFKALIKGDSNVFAWYTPSIPLNHGPNSFSGVPGLVLELHFGKFYWIVRNIEFNHKDAEFIVEPTKGELITSQEYKDRFKGFFNEN